MRKVKDWWDTMDVETEIECEEIDHTALRQTLGSSVFGKSATFDDEHSQEDPNSDWMDFDFGAAATTRSEVSRSREWSDTVEPETLDETESPKNKLSSALRSRVTTGAALLSAADSAVSNVATFTVGQSVRHPRYGLGQVIEVSRLMKRQTVVVQFEQENRSETFISDKCPLTVVGLS